MNKYGQHNKAKTLTKKQRKQLTPVIANSIKTGDVLVIAGSTFRGRVPEYQRVEKENGSKWFLKIAKGIPFVKVVPA